MHKIGDNIVYGSNGVMTVIDIREEEVLDTLRKYYVLQPYGVRSASLTFVPIDNKALVAQMRPLLSREDVLEIIHSIDDVPETEWVKDNRIRSERFKSIMESGDRTKIISMIGAIYRSGLRRLEEGKKNYLSDENMMHKAEKLLYSEFALVLGIPEEDIPAFIESEKKRK